MLKKHYIYVVWSLALYFGWLLAFPYFGLVMGPAALEAHIGGRSLVYVFLSFHALGYLGGALFLKKTYSWKYLIWGSLLGTAAINLMTWLSPAALWGPGFALLGFISSFYVLGWSRLFSIYSPAEKVYILVHMVVRANLIAVAIFMFSTLFAGAALIVAALAPLAASGWLFVTRQAKFELDAPWPEKVERSFPGLLVLILCLFIFAFKLSAGFTYSVIHFSYPAMEDYHLISAYYEYFPYLLTLILLLRFYGRWQRHFLAFAGVSLLGLAFIAFALLEESLVAFLLTVSLLEPAFALLNVFTWSLLGDLSSRYGFPYRFFGFGLFAVIFGTFSGGMIGDHLVLYGELPRYFTALYAAAAIFLTLIIIPWLRERTEHESTGLALTGDLTLPLPEGSALEQLIAEAALTGREKDIVKLIMQGLSNKLIAEQLFISENTLKTHLRKIYAKFGVHKKSELLARFIEKKAPLP